MADEPLNKLRMIVEIIDSDPEYWTDNRIYWQVTGGFAVTAGDLRSWMLAIDGEVVES